MLVFTARTRNSEVVAEALTAAHIDHVVCRDMAEFSGWLAGGAERASALIVTERALALDARDVITAFQEDEPVWSEVPVVLLTPRDQPPSWARPLRNVILVRQPTSARQLRSVVSLALELRGHQREVHDLLQQLEEQRDWSELALVHSQQRLDQESVDREGLEERLTATRRQLNRRREEDRSMLARELHDNIIQRLLYLSMRLAPGAEVARAAGLDTVEDLIGQARQDVHTTVKELRRLIRELRPAGLELGFEAALKPSIARLDPAIDVRTDIEEASDLPDDVVLCLFRIAQEALRNIERHADADRVRVAVRRRGRHVHMFIADDGNGFVVPEALSDFARDDHFGLLGAQEFAAGLGGDLKVRSSRGKGTCLRARIPLGEQAAD